MVIRRLMDSKNVVPVRFIRIFISVSLLAVLWIFTPCTALSWEGHDRDKGDCVQIDDGTELLEGHEIEFYDCSDGEYHRGNIESVTRDDGIQIEIYDYDTDEYRTFELDDGLVLEM